MSDNFPAIIENNDQAMIEKEEKLFKQLSETKYLAYMNLVQASSDLAKPPHRLPAGNFALVENQKPTDLGDETQVVLIAWRATSRIVDKSGTAIKITSFHDPEDPEFKRVQAEAEKKQDGNIIYYYGFEYLLWIDSLAKFATFYCNSATLRRAVKESIHQCLSRGGQIKLANFKSKFIDPPSSPYSWFGMDASELEGQEPENAPDPDEMNRVYSIFKNAKASEAEETVEVVEDTDR